MRRYRIEFSPDIPAEHTAMECTESEFVFHNDADELPEWEDICALSTGQSVTLGGGAAPITVITCIEE